jgi:hypothetical protein
LVTNSRDRSTRLRSATPSSRTIASSTARSVRRAWCAPRTCGAPGGIQAGHLLHPAKGSKPADAAPTPLSPSARPFRAAAQRGAVAGRSVRRRGGLDPVQRSSASPPPPYAVLRCATRPRPGPAGAGRMFRLSRAELADSWIRGRRDARHRPARLDSLRLAKGACLIAARSSVPSFFRAPAGRHPELTKPVNDFAGARTGTEAR